MGYCGLCANRVTVWAKLEFRVQARVRVRVGVTRAVHVGKRQHLPSDLGLAGRAASKQGHDWASEVRHQAVAACCQGH